MSTEELAQINAIKDAIADWYSVTTLSKCFLTTDGLIYRLHFGLAAEESERTALKMFAQSWKEPAP